MGDQLITYKPGLYYVVEGFLDILLPADEPRPNNGPSAMRSASSDTDSLYTSDNKEPEKAQSRKLLFTVKPGGIAGYLGMLEIRRLWLVLTLHPSGSLRNALIC
jgi:hypothetical protein